MIVPRAIRELLVCPNCHGPLRDVTTGEALDCVACRLRFPIRDGIPVMLIERAERLAPDAR